MISVLIPSRNEFLLKKTIETTLEAAEGEIEIIAVCDGYWPVPNIQDNPRVTLIHHTEPVGQRHAVNEAAEIAKGKYILKTDGHSTFDKGFDVKLAKDCEYDWTVIPRMYNLHAFDWVCKNKHNFYQDKFDPHKTNFCPTCQEPLEIEYIWKPRQHKRTDFMYMDKDLRVQYWNSYRKRPEAKGDIIDVMNGQGACWFQHRDRFLELGGLDEKHGFWGQVGVEVACKAWLSGGRQIVNKKTWFSHMFRTTGPFSFPYKIRASKQEDARQYSRDLWLNDKWPQAKRRFQWLLDKFSPVPTWNGEVKKPVRALTKGIIYYTDNVAPEPFLKQFRDILKKTVGDIPIVWVSQRPIREEPNIVIPSIGRSHRSLCRQVLTGLEYMKTDIIYFAEHDMIYHPSHFEFVPPRKDVFCYNLNRWWLQEGTGLASYREKQGSLSQMVSYRDIAMEFYSKRMALFEQGLDLGRVKTEPGKYNIPQMPDYKMEDFFSEHPNIDIRHEYNYTKTDRFKTNGSYTIKDSIPFWGHTKGRYKEFISGNIPDTN